MMKMMSSKKWLVRYLLSLAILAGGSTLLNAQAILGFKKYPLANSGCQAMFPAPPEAVDITIDADSNTIYSTRAVVPVGGDNYQFCVTTIRLKADASEIDIANQLSEFLDYFKSTQNIIDADGYKRINNLLRGKTAHGISDNWTDQAGNHFSVTAWGAGRTLAVLYILGAKTLVPAANRSTFMNGFNFPASF